MYSAGTCLCRDNVTGSGCDQCGAGFQAFNRADTSSEPCEGERGISLLNLCKCCSG